MKKNRKILFILFLLFIAAEKVSAIDPFTAWVDPHDSLLFDGGTQQSIDQVSFYEDVQCYTRVQEVRGNVIGKVLMKEIVKACGEDETLYTAVERLLKKGDMLMHGSEVITSVDSKVELGIYMMETGFSSVWLIVGPDSRLTTPDFRVSCKNTLNEKDIVHPEVIKVIKGVITYDAPPDAKFKATTKGKRSSAKHTKTRYSHEVKIDGIDTIDVIRVYKGSVEVSMETIENPNEEEMTKKMDALSQDMLAGKISAEEMQARLTEFQNYGQNLTDLMTPVEVNEGNKCIVTKTARTVEPLGEGDEESK
jgi:hypothetical protein